LPRRSLRSSRSSRSPGTRDVRRVGTVGIGDEHIRGCPRAPTEDNLGLIRRQGTTAETYLEHGFEA
jgi:hypothetical protein